MKAYEYTCSVCSTRFVIYDEHNRPPPDAYCPMGCTPLHITAHKWRRDIGPHSSITNTGAHDAREV